MSDQFQDISRYLRTFRYTLRTKLNQNKGKQIDSEIDGREYEIGLAIVTKPIPDKSSMPNGLEAEEAADKTLTSVAVRRGETLSQIIFRIYGRKDPDILKRPF